MKLAKRRQQGKSALELIEEAVHLLRSASSQALAAYYIGSLPFVFGLMFFWADMSHGAFARQHVVEASLGVAVLFLWMKCWQAVYAVRIRAQFAGRMSPKFDFARCRHILVTQVALQPTALFVLPVTFIAALPFGWAYAFYQNLTALADAKPAGLRTVIRKSSSQAALWPGQNHLMLGYMSLFGFVVFLNCTIMCFILPGLIKMLFGIESVFTRSPYAMFNTTFFMAMFGLTYLCVDPILKTIYALRCFYGESLQSGEDLKAELKSYSPQAQRLAACLLLSVMFTQNLRAGNSGATHPQPLPGGELRSSNVGQFPSWEGSGVGSTENKTARVSLSRATSFPAITILAQTKPASSPQAAPQNHPQTSPAGVSPNELDRAINETLKERKYSWRMPREKAVEQDGEQGFIARFFERAGNMLRKWAKATLIWLNELWDKIFGRRRSGGGGNSGYGWIWSLEILFYTLLAAVIAASVIFLMRHWRRKRQPPATATQAIEPVPDLTDENVGAGQLPEDGWTQLARELLARGEFRLALRAFYLASLAHLAEKNLVSLAKFKSNRDYERELCRRGHSFPDMIVLFGENVSIFDRSWYGMHEVSGELVNEFASNVERIKTT